MHRCLLPLLCAVPALGAVETTPDAVILSNAGLRAAFTRRDGSLSLGRGAAVLHSGEYGLWRLQFHGADPLSAVDAAEVEVEPDGETVRLTYRHARANVVVAARACDMGVELQATVTGHTAPIAQLELPGRMRFAPGDITRVIVPSNGNSGVGMALDRKYFERQPFDRPTAWEQHRTFDAGYRALFGDGLDQRADNEDRVPARLGADAAAWLPAPLAERVATAALLVNRPSKRAQVDQIVVDSANGPWFAGSRLGGQGLLWRFGGRVEDDEAALAAQLVAAVVDRLPPGGGKLGLLALRNGPVAGMWSAVTIEAWRSALRQTEAVRTGRLTLVEIDTAAAMMAALADDGFAAILNPYGEGIPEPETGVPAAVEAIGSFVRAGGHWFEVGGYPFFTGLTPAPYLNDGIGYPAAFADFLAVETLEGAYGISRCQPRTWEPWAGATDANAILLPGRLAWGGDDAGGWVERAYAAYRAGDWTAPPVRLTSGTVPELLAAYAAANQIIRPLAAKVPPETYERLRQSVLLYYAGDAAEKQAFLDRLPAHTLIHFADYLKGGFDKEYPDHLPPHPNFGTQEALRAFFLDAQRRGHLIMPYTNPTWWCEDPRGPTFLRDGDAPLLRTLEGKLSFEQYASNTGYTVCHWHPAVQAANRVTVTQFSEQLPVDVLFQDQCAARGWRYDMNPASPTPDAYTEGLLSQVAEDAARAPLSTEGGWDQVARYETQICGMAFDIVTPPGWTGGGSLLKERLSPELWTVYPVAQHLAHESCMMLFHDLGQFVTDAHSLSWALGLGFSLSMRTSANALDKPALANWLAWTDRIQKSVVSRYLGQPVTAFEHHRPEPATVADDGYFRARYGPIDLVTNLGPEPRAVDGDTLPAHGFRARGDGLDAGYVLALGGEAVCDTPIGYVVEGRRAWVYGPAAAEVRLPTAAGLVTVRLPDAEDGGVAPPAELAAVAPRDRTGAKPRVAVLRFEGWHPSWTKVEPDQWLAALRGSALARDGVEVVAITDWTSFEAALRAGSREYMAVVNPYGELFPVATLADYRQTLELVRAYVRNGGSWCEVGGHSFYVARVIDGPSEAIGPRGIDVLGVPVGPGDVDAAPEPLTVTETGRRWLGAELAAEVERRQSRCNRGLPVGPLDPGHTGLVRGAELDLIGGYRLGGWGYLWRVGALDPDPEVSLKVLVAALDHVYRTPPEPATHGQQPRLWEVALP